MVDNKLKKNKKNNKFSKLFIRYFSIFKDFCSQTL